MIRLKAELTQNPCFLRDAIPRNLHNPSRGEGEEIGRLEQALVEE
jgi:hypothetical protein